MSCGILFRFITKQYILNRRIVSCIDVLQDFGGAWVLIVLLGCVVRSVVACVIETTIYEKDFV